MVDRIPVGHYTLSMIAGAEQVRTDPRDLVTMAILYQTGMSIRELAKMYQMSFSGARTRLVDAGVTFRPRGTCPLDGHHVHTHCRHRIR